MSIQSIIAQLEERGEHSLAEEVRAFMPLLRLAAPVAKGIVKLATPIVKNAAKFAVQHPIKTGITIHHLAKQHQKALAEACTFLKENGKENLAAELDEVSSKLFRHANKFYQITPPKA